MPPRYPPRETIPALLADLVHAPYQFVVDPKLRDDLGYLVELRRDGTSIGRFELYPYTVVGPGTHRPPDERRVQLELARRAGAITRDPPRGRIGIMLGLRTVDVDGTRAAALILAFSFGIFRGVTSRSSIQFPKRLLEEAEVFGVAGFAKVVHSLGTPTRAITIAMKPELLPFFLTQVAGELTAPQDWEPAAVAQVVDSMRRYIAAPEDLRTDAVAPAPVPADAERARLRERATREILQPIRDSRFSKAVRKAYGHRCAACDIQLELIEAAHIDPVEDLESVDETSNGIALCALHHLAYDSTLIDILPTGMIIINEARVRELREKIRADGLDNFRKGLRAAIRFPESERDRPGAEHFTRRAAFLARQQ